VRSITLNVSTDHHSLTSDDHEEGVLPDMCGSGDFCFVSTGDDAAVLAIGIPPEVAACRIGCLSSGVV